MIHVKQSELMKRTRALAQAGERLVAICESLQADSDALVRLVEIEPDLQPEAEKAMDAIARAAELADAMADVILAKIDNLAEESTRP